MCELHGRECWSFESTKQHAFMHAPLKSYIDILNFFATTNPALVPRDSIVRV